MSEDDINPYAVLGIPTDAQPKAIETAYKKIAARIHPDKTAPQGLDTKAEFQLLQKCYGMLRDTAKRQEYDRRHNLNLGMRIRQWKESAKGTAAEEEGDSRKTGKQKKRVRATTERPSTANDDAAPDEIAEDYVPVEGVEDPDVAFPDKITMDLTLMRPPALGGKRWGFDVNRHMTVTSVDPAQTALSGLVPFARVLTVNNHPATFLALRKAFQDADTVHMRVEVKTTGVRLERAVPEAEPWGFSVHPDSLEVLEISDGTPSALAQLPLRQRILFVGTAHIRTMDDLKEALQRSSGRKTLLLVLSQREVTHVT